MCGCVYVWVCVWVGFVMCGCCMCEFCNVWVCAHVDFVMCVCVFLCGGFVMCDCV